MHKLTCHLTAVAALAMSLSGAVSARENWDAAHHYRRDEVNHRFERGGHRTYRQGREGEMSRSRDASFHRDDNGMRQQDDSMLTRQENHAGGQFRQ